MAQLVFIDGRNMGNVVALSASNSLGRARENSIVLGDPSVRERHASIQYKDGAYRILQMESGSPISVNGRDVKDEPLRHGDIVTIGEVTILFSDEGASQPKTAPRVELPGEATESVVQSRLRTFESADDIVTTFRRREPLAKHLETLYKVSAALNSTLRLEEVVDTLLAIIFDVLKPDRAFILMYDDLGQLRVRGERVSEKSRLTGFVRVSRGVLNEVVERREALLTQDATQDERFNLRQSVVEQNIQSAMCVPLIKKDKILGVIYVDTLTPLRSYTEIDLHLMTGIASQAAIAIENVLHYNRSVDYSRKLATLGAISRKISSYLSREVILRESVHSVLQLFECKRCTILVAKGDVLTVGASAGIDPQLWEEIKIKPGEGFCGKVFAENQPMLVSDASKVPGAGMRPYESQSFLIVPVVARAEGIQPGSRPIGVIAVTDKDNQGLFSLDDQEFLSVFAAQAGIALANATLFEKATVDTLTKLFTRQFFFAQAEEILNAHKSGAQALPLALLICDLDHFKQKNDKYGHQMGDEILSQSGKILKEQIGGLCARYGGEELVALLPGSNRDRAMQAAEGLRKALEAQEFGDGESIRCTMSIGVATLAPTDTVETLLRKADNALYAAKNTGRNRVNFYDSLEIPAPTKSGVMRLHLPPKA